VWVCVWKWVGVWVEGVGVRVDGDRAWAWEVGSCDLLALAMALDGADGGARALGLPGAAWDCLGLPGTAWGCLGLPGTACLGLGWLPLPVWRAGVCGLGRVVPVKGNWGWACVW